MNWNKKKFYLVLKQFWETLKKNVKVTYNNSYFSLFYLFLGLLYGWFCIFLDLAVLEKNQRFYFVSFLLFFFFLVKAQSYLSCFLKDIHSSSVTDSRDLYRQNSKYKKFALTRNTFELICFHGKMCNNQIENQSPYILTYFKVFLVTIILFIKKLRNLWTGTNNILTNQK